MRLAVVLPEVLVIGALLGAIWAYQTPISARDKARRRGVRPIHSNSDNEIQMLQKDTIGSMLHHQQLDCTRYCNADGLCDSPAFYACINKDPDRYGVSGRKRVAFVPGGRRVEYAWAQGTW
jgi:hypothetical protein